MKKGVYTRLWNWVKGGGRYKIVEPGEGRVKGLYLFKIVEPEVKIIHPGGSTRSNHL